jgi:hypothetical protein
MEVVVDLKSMNRMVVIEIDQKLIWDLVEIDLLVAKDENIQDDIFQVLKIQLNHNHLIACFHKYLNITKQIDNGIKRKRGRKKQENKLLNFDR